ncbi:hypothetical protein WJX77_003189 [Trebouxia sp. C0004]
MTTNPEWDEIKENLLPGQTAVNRPDITARVFAGKLQSLWHVLDNGEFFGKVDAMVHVVEYQKRGLPHAHIQLILHREDKPRCGDDYDSIVSAEIPDKDADPELHEIVGACMIHGPCGPLSPDAPCTEDKKCKKHFPIVFSWRLGRTGMAILNIKAQRWAFSDEEERRAPAQRAVSCSTEAAYRLLGFDMDGILSKVTRLAVHEEGAHRVYYKYGVTLQSVVKRTSTDSLLEWFKTNQINERNDDLTYLQFVERFSRDKTKKRWTYRKQTQRHKSIARMYTTHPEASEAARSGSIGDIAKTVLWRLPTTDLVTKLV